MKIKKSTLYYILGTIILLAIAGSFMLKTIPSSTGSLVELKSDGEAQKIVIGVKDYNYYPNTIKVKVGVPLSISLDKSVYGCLRDFTIRDFGIRKYLKTPEDTIEFTPTKKGTFKFACSMGMGTGTLIVE